MSSSSKLEKATIVLDVNFHTPNKERPGSLNDVEVDSDKDSLRLSKEYIRSPHYNRAAAVRTGFRQWLKRRALPSPFKHGTYLIPLKVLDEVYAKLEEAKEEYNNAADKLAKDWSNIVENAKKRLRSQFDPKNYPSAEGFRRGFGVDWSVRQFSVPEEATVGDVIFDLEMKKAQQTWKKAEVEVTMALRAGMNELLDKLLGQLEGSADGSKKRVSQAAVRNLEEFFDIFAKRNVLGDVELKKLITAAKKVLKGKDASDFKSDEIKAQVTGKLKEVSKSLGSLIEETKRQFHFED